MTSVQTDPIPLENGLKAGSPALTLTSGDGTLKTTGTMTRIPITEFDVDDSPYQMVCNAETAGKVVFVAEIVVCALMFIVTIVLAHRLGAGSFFGGFFACSLMIAFNMAIVVLFCFGIKRQKPLWIIPYLIVKIGAIALCLICIVFFIASSQRMVSAGGAVLFTIFLLGFQVPFAFIARQTYFYFYEKNHLYKKALISDAYDIANEDELSEIRSNESRRTLSPSPLPQKY